jgi:death-on-curing protein
VTGIDAVVLAKASRADLADGALHAPAAGFGDDDFYPDIYDKAGVRCCRLAWNHPLPDGNKRAAWAALLMFIDLNRGVWDPDPPDVDQAEQAMLAVASGDVDEQWVSDWVRERVQFSAAERWRPTERRPRVTAPWTKVEVPWPTWQPWASTMWTSPARAMPRPGG